MPIGAPRGGPVARIAQPGRRRGGEVDIAHQQLLLELPGTRDRAPGVVDDARMPVEDEFILPAHEGAEGHAGHVVTSTLRKHAFALASLARVIRRGGDVDEQCGTCERLVARGGTRLPHVLADREAEALAVELGHGAGAARLEIALLVEDTVVRQVDLAVDRANRSSADQRRGVEHVLGALGEPDDRDDAGELGGERPQGRRSVGEKVLLEQQVLRRISGDGELRKENEIGSRRARIACSVANPLEVALDVPDRGIELIESEAHAISMDGRATWERLPRIARISWLAAWRRKMLAT